MAFNKAKVSQDMYCWKHFIKFWNSLQQLATFSRVWYLFDAKWQCPHLSGERIARILRGEHKPIYYPGGKEPIARENMVTLILEALLNLETESQVKCTLEKYVLFSFNALMDHARREKNKMKRRW